MKNKLNKLLIAGALTFSAQAVIAEEVVNVYNWSDYIDEQVNEDFTAATGIKVVYDVFDSNEFLQSKLLAGGSGYDVVVPSSSFLARQIQAGVFQKLDKSKLSNISNMWGKIEEQVEQFGPLNDYSVNYMWGTTGIGYNVEMINERMDNAPTTSLAMVFDPDVVSKFADCGVHLLDAPEEIIPAALAYLGEDPRSTDKDVIAKAEDVLTAVRPYIQKFHSSQYIDALGNGDICLVVGWSGDVFQALYAAEEAENGVEIVYAIPDEGALMWFDQLAIPKDAPNTANAHKYINWIMDPEQIATATNYVWYANGNFASQPLLEPDLLSDPAVYPTEEVMQNTYISPSYSDPKIQRVVTRTWTKVKTGQ
ncbi:polyamine ABC transporter substrate-binding protein [Candidatus Pseudothioglobus singularis]|uniref:Putrescine-binding periplasmic protein n=1 Tax=Candidatus Pseudothioglobus singularis PS1 TaxID=1125411 RepID=A0A0M4LEW9_9GAMM|nr:polyamine ABC transporter substrate-binding protein [Candidatus Pseudothioglobus singularis]ALE01568.1 putrescine/spermidine ABC transporter substrate-binding protein [Candidatus Pseudothioglobus singularis PS1]